MLNLDNQKLQNLTSNQILRRVVFTSNKNEESKLKSKQC